MIESTVHVHTTFCDGKSSMEDMVASAYRAGLKCIGFSGHSYTNHDDFGMQPERVLSYIEEARRLKTLYSEKIHVLCGIELDAFTEDLSHLDKLDYVIGSIHSVRADDGVVYIIDGSVKRFEHNVMCAFGGDYIKMCRLYYQQLASFIGTAKPDIVGHFDLVTKYNEKFNYFDTEDHAYRNAALEALDCVLETGAVIEVNTGAISRGYKTLPYPANFLLKRVLEKKGKVIITTDAHADTALTAFSEDAENLLKTIGFTTVCELGEHGFYERTI